MYTDLLVCLILRSLQCDAVWCSVLQCVAVCCSVLQCVAVCCSVLQSVWSYDLIQILSRPCLHLISDTNEVGSVVRLWLEKYTCIQIGWSVRSYDLIRDYVKLYKSLLQNIVSLIGLFCKRDLCSIQILPRPCLHLISDKNEVTSVVRLWLSNFSALYVCLCLCLCLCRVSVSVSLRVCDTVCMCVCVCVCVMLMLTFKTLKSSLIPLMKGLCSSNPSGFEFSVFGFFSRKILFKE